MVLKTLKDRLDSLQSRLQEEIDDKRTPAKGRQLVGEIEACISAGLTAFPSELLDRYSIEIEEQSLATTRIENIIEEAYDLNHDIYGATHKTSGRVDR